jgi:hypothetical protein
MPTISTPLPKPRQSAGTDGGLESSASVDMVAGAQKKSTGPGYPESDFGLGGIQEMAVFTGQDFCPVGQAAHRAVQRWIAGEMIC